MMGPRANWGRMTSLAGTGVTTRYGDQRGGKMHVILPHLRFVMGVLAKDARQPPHVTSFAILFNLYSPSDLFVSYYRRFPVTSQNQHDLHKNRCWPSNSGRSAASTRHKTNFWNPIDQKVS